MVNVQKIRKLAKGDKRIFEDMAAPSYNFNVTWLDKFIKLANDKKYSGLVKEHLSHEEINNLKEIYSLISPVLDVDINKTLRLVEIEEDLINLVKYTDNKIFHRPLFFPTVFINNNIEFDGVIIKGILISEAIIHNGEQQILFGDSYREFGKDSNDYAIAFITIDTENKTRNINLISLIDKEKVKSSMSEIEGKNIKIADFIKNMIVNIVDMVEGMDRDLSVSVIETTKEQNLKRINKKQLPIPTKVFIRAHAEFKKYVQKFNIDLQEHEDDLERRKVSYKFMVIGHWRHFRAERFIRKKGDRIWIKPFWKGDGIPIAKEYILVD